MVFVRCCLKGTVSYSVKSGTYYIRISRDFGALGPGDVTMNAEFPASENIAKINYITINMERGDSLPRR